MRDLTDAASEKEEADADEGESRMDAVVRRLREQGHEVTMASEVDDTESAERGRKKRARQALRQKLLLNEPPG